VALHGVDVSAFQPDWQPADNDAFVIVKQTEGTSWTSSVAQKQVDRARAKNLHVGHYHFLWPGDAIKQARYFMQQANIRPGDTLWCDWENTKGGHPSVEDAAKFIAEVKLIKPGYRVGLYCNKSDWLNTSVKAGDALWLAQWGVTQPTISSTWTIWQYADSPIDQNKANFDSLDSLKAWALGERYSIKYQSLYVELGAGKYVTPIDKQILIACAKASGWGTVRLSQGGLSTSVAASALTHAGLGAADVAPDGRSKDAVWKYAAALLRSGIIAFPRGYGGDSFPQHIHCVSGESAAHAHQQARDQIDEYRRGGDGLVGDRPYVGPNVKLDRWANSPYHPKNIKPDTGKYVVDTDRLYGRDVDGAIVRQRLRGYVIQAASQVYRWDRWNVCTTTPTYYAAEYLKPAT